MSILLNFLEKLKIWLAVRLVWRFKGTLPEAVRAFQATEADGVWHLHRGLRNLRNPRHRAILFAHSLEEESHAEAFAHIYRDYGDRPFAPASYEREDLYGPDEPGWKIFAFVHVGEEDATNRFRYIHRYLDDGSFKQALAKIIHDEEGHIDLTHRMLLDLGATEGAIRRQVIKVRLVRAWQQWLRVGKRVVDKLASVLLSIVYFLIGPLLYLSARNKLAHRFVVYDNNQIKRLG